jgi:hypothetical protein
MSYSSDADTIGIVDTSTTTPLGARVKAAPPSGSDGGLIVRIAGNTNVVPTAGFTVQIQDSLGASLTSDGANALKVAISTGVTLVEQQSFAPTSVPLSTTEGIVNTGAVTLTLGQKVFYNLSGEPGTVTGAGLFVYVAIKGATSGNYYAVCQNGSTISGVFIVPSAEKLNIVRRNSDATNAHVLSGYWQAMTGAI